MADTPSKSNDTLRSIFNRPPFGAIAAFCLVTNSIIWPAHWHRSEAREACDDIKTQLATSIPDRTYSFRSHTDIWGNCAISLTSGPNKGAFIYDSKNNTLSPADYLEHVKRHPEIAQRAYEP